MKNASEEVSTKKTDEMEWVARAAAESLAAELGVPLDKALCALIKSLGKVPAKKPRGWKKKMDEAKATEAEVARRAEEERIRVDAEKAEEAEKRRRIQEAVAALPNEYEKVYKLFREGKVPREVLVGFLRKIKKEWGHNTTTLGGKSIFDVLGEDYIYEYQDCQCAIFVRLDDPDPEDFIVEPLWCGSRYCPPTELYDSKDHFCLFTK